MSTLINTGHILFALFGKNIALMLWNTFSGSALVIPRAYHISVVRFGTGTRFESQSESYMDFRGILFIRHSCQAASSVNELGIWKTSSLLVPPLEKGRICVRHWLDGGAGNIDQGRYPEMTTKKLRSWRGLRVSDTVEESMQHSRLVRPYWSVFPAGQRAE